MQDRLVDVHHHILPPVYDRLVGEERIGPGRPSPAGRRNERPSSLASMNRNGIETAFAPEATMTGASQA